MSLIKALQRRTSWFSIHITQRHRTHQRLLRSLVAKPKVRRALQRGCLFFLSLSLIIPSLCLAQVMPTPQPVAQKEEASPSLGELGAMILETALLTVPDWYFKDNKGPIHLKNRAPGSFECGLEELLYNSGVQRALLKRLGHTPIPPTSNPPKHPLRPWEQVLGVTLNDEMKSPKTQGRFIHLSAETLKRISTFKVSPQAIVLGYPIRTLYKQIFKRSVRLFAMTHHYLISTGVLDFEREAYIRAMRAEASFNGPEYLRSRFSKKLDDYHSFDWCQTPERAFGFWLRRDVDGSRRALWGVLEDALSKLDSKFLKRLNAKKYNVPSRPVFGGALTTSQLQKFYQFALASPYEYMFQGEGHRGAVKIDQHSLGTYTAGINGLLNYLSFNEAAHKLAKLGTTHSWGNAQAWELISGYSIHKPLGEHEKKRPFAFINPEIIQWGIEQLIPPVDLEIHGYTAQQLYTYLFSRFFRLMALSYIELHKNLDVNKEALDYTLAMLEPSFNGIDYLGRRYAKTLPDYARAVDYTSMQPWGAMGFWIRRQIDRSSPLLWGGLKIVLTRFDASFYEESVPKDLK